ncbi:MAG TPA: ABC transporter permease [Longimicrobiaceae bacterium]|nr:ABC transporter permease [Longimicrobiaceae bacterium]
MRWLSEARERLRALAFRARDEAELDEELRFHLEMETERLVREGLDRQEARRRAAIAFGGVEKYREEVRDARGLGWATGMSLDFKLGFRMLGRYPGLTLVGGLAIAFAIATGAATFEFLTQMVRPTIPLHEGGRIVGIRVWDAAGSRVEPRAVHDFLAWRGELRGVEHLGAFRTAEHNLIAGDGPAEPVTAAEMTASGFRVARVPALLGRPLLEEDEREGAPPVVVLGHDVWRTRFGGDPGVVGRDVRLGNAVHTVVGVMPEGFAFPVAHDLWVPLRPGALDPGPRQGPEIRVFGRLAPGATLREAQAELATLGRRAAAAFPDTHEHLRPEVLPYAQSITGVRGLESLALMSVNAFLVMLLVLVCANVALLMFARAATRESEIVVRSALGASRGRIVAQLFAEAMVLGGVAAVVGLAAAGFTLRWWLGVSEAEAGGRLPFWFSGSLSPAAVLYAGLLAVLGAVVAGVVPALKVTGRGLDARLRQATAGGGGLRLGGVWTAVIVAQVAVTVAFPATAFFARQYVAGIRSLEVGFPAEEYLSARLEVDGEAPPYRELERRLEAEPGVAGVTFASRLPRTHHPPRRVEVDGGAAAPDPVRGHRVGTAAVDADYFDVLGAPILAGRAFHSGDLEPDSRAVIVNESFVDRVLGGRNPVGLRVRYPGRGRPGQPGQSGEEPDAGYEIVGVVKDLGVIADDPAEGAGLYHPLAPGAAFPVHLAVHVRGDPESFAPRLRAIATEVDPALRLHEVLPLDEVGSTLWLELDFLFKLLVLVSSIALLLSLAGIYSVMSFTVSRRTREIGIRVALGADPWRVAAAILSRPLAQVGVGLAAGAVLVTALTRVVSGLSAKEVGMVAAYMALMMGVCMLACIVPTRRALRVEPTDALRAEG